MNHVHASLVTSFKRARTSLLIAIAIAALGAPACGNDDAPGSAGTSAGASGAGTGNGAGGAGGAGGGQGNGGSAVSAGGSITGGTGNSAGRPNAGHCGPPAIDISSDLTGCSDYDPAANGLPKDDRPFDVSDLTVKGSMANVPLALSRELTDQMVDVEFWGADSSCGPARQLLGKTTKLGVECVDTTPTAAYSHLLVIMRGNAGLGDIRVCSSVKCP